jgi:hypothetical protein
MPSVLTVPGIRGGNGAIFTAVHHTPLNVGGIAPPVSVAEYQEALHIAEDIVRWVETWLRRQEDEEE